MITDPKQAYSLINAPAAATLAIDSQKALLKFYESSLVFATLPIGMVAIQAVKQNIEATEKLHRLFSA